MSLPTNTHEKLSPAVSEGESSLLQWIRIPLAALAFWAAITIPVLYVPLLLNGIESGTGLGVLLGLLGLHLLTLIGGRNYHSQPED